MSKKPKTTVTNRDRILKVMDRLRVQINGLDPVDDADELDSWCDCFDSWLDDIASNDGFGTEGQLDPRGDFREHEWSMRRVEGLDK